MIERPANERPAIDAANRFKARLALGRTATRTIMLVERGWPLVLPLVLVVCLFLGLAWLGVFAALPQMLRLGLTVIIGLAAFAALYPMRFFRAPTANDIDRRLETANALLHNPILVQSDQPSGHENGFSQALWREHQRRMAEQLDTLRADLPRTRVPEYDRWGLRALPVLLLVVGFAFSLGSGGGSVSDAFRVQPAAEAVPPRIDAWVTPPPYTRKPPVFLSANVPDGSFTIPAGSQFTVRVTGGSGKEALSYTGKNGPAHLFDPAGDAPKVQSDPQAAAAVRKFTGKINADGALVLASGPNEIGRWVFAITPDKPPQIQFVGEPTQAANGTLELNYRIADDYGAAKASAEFSLADAQKPKAHPLYAAPDMPLALPRRGDKAAAAKTTKDLTQHVWAGSMIRLILVATDDAGQTARSETRTFVMPERPFANPLARSIIEQRRLLGLDALAKPRVLQLMDAITLRPEDTFDNMGHYLAIMSARSRLKLASTDDQLRDVVSYLWDIALGIEEGDLSDAEKRLRQAQQDLQNLLKNGGSDEEIAKAMQELRQAMNDYLREFAQRQKDQKSARIPGNAQELRPSDLNRMMDQIENLARSGNRDKAQELLSQLENMMNNLQAGQPGQPGEQNNEMRQQMDKLGEIMRRQQEMMNETFRMDQAQRGQNRDQQMGESDDPGQEEPFGQQQGQNGKPGGGQMSPQEFSDAMKQLQQEQGKLRGELGQLGKGLEGLGMKPNKGLGEAGEAMGDAGKSLGEGEGESAVANQGRALEALRKGARDMMQQLQAMQRDQGGAKPGGRQNADRDPLGRPRATNGPDFGDSVKVPDEIDVQRARRILDAIRKRLGDALSPDIERSYLERLLDLK
ncbi:TIGR02302 family protein [Manganibacter manganicus]|uniref:TIGR02302 family protein n=1 Tax=Manganibacter manganicus TaxID=1873176 RepID=A0A1V8RT18_9HYPH|nr:TIGR02302 family protein [Pseudaminobacter manganicus]OQM76293.1 TIGR02302 family protein [Pseudaminobacter manganicus]